MKTAYVINEKVFASNADGLIEYDFDYFDLKGENTFPTEKGKLFKVSYETGYIRYNTINIYKVKELNIEKELKSLEKRANKQCSYRVTDPGVKGRMAVQARIRGLQISKQRYAREAIQYILKEIK